MSFSHNTKKRALTHIGRALALTFLTLAIFLAAVMVVIPGFTGANRYTVLTNSMAPKYPPGTFLVVQPKSAGTLEVGDIITYQLESGQPDLVTHRIVGFGTMQQSETTYITRGDNNGATDEQAVLDVQVRGELLYAVPWVGRLAHLAGQSRDTFTPLLAAGLLLYGTVMLGRGAISARKRKKAPVHDETAVEAAISDEASDLFSPPHGGSVESPAAGRVGVGQFRPGGRHFKKPGILQSAAR